MDGRKGQRAWTAHLFALAAAVPLLAAVPATALADPPPPTVAHPADGAVLPASTVAFDGTTEIGHTVTVSEGGAVRLTVGPSVDGNWSGSFDAPDGSHTYAVTATR